MSNTRQKLVDTAKELLWERGYDAMSSNHVLEYSGVGKGSMYHHFKGKKELAQIAIEERSEELVAEFNAEFRDDLPLLDRFSSYLCKQRNGLRGCRIGRLVSDISITEDELRLPISRLFGHIEHSFTEALQQAEQQGEIHLQGKAEDIAAALVACVQGAFILSRAHSNSTYMDKVGHGGMQLLQSSVSFCRSDDDRSID
ncbi:TetR/AcrR family transcriptional regulator [Oceanospirillum maris]|jgi:AcrR family transcriptional regulator|uniref:TetR/AcrR family transcriptional regulator n=1 Tax=Oceanospirillum maris TaxID=64977 RepID=UPI0004153FD5|nr:TetR/AcrR family transcriptional regulator [Oceanospirillum maris]